MTAELATLHNVIADEAILGLVFDNATNEPLNKCLLRFDPGDSDFEDAINMRNFYKDRFIEVNLGKTCDKINFHWIKACLVTNRVAVWCSRQITVINAVKQNNSLTLKINKQTIKRVTVVVVQRNRC